VKKQKTVSKKSRKRSSNTEQKILDYIKNTTRRAKLTKSYPRDCTRKNCQNKCSINWQYRNICRLQKAVSTRTAQRQYYIFNIISSKNPHQITQYLRSE
jgi:hypothetical protein